MEGLCAPEMLNSIAGEAGEHPLSYPVALASASDAVQEPAEVSEGIAFSDSWF